MELSKIWHIRPHKDNTNVCFSENSTISVSNVFHSELFVLHSSWGILFRLNRLKVIKLLKILACD